MRFLKFLEGIYYGRYEKFVHFIVSLILFLSFSIFLNWILALIAAFFIGVVKELYDAYIRKTKFDLQDLIANIFGIITGIIIYISFKNL